MQMEKPKILTEKHTGTGKFQTGKDSQDDTVSNKKVGQRQRRRKRKNLRSRIAPASLPLDMNDEKAVLRILQHRITAEKKLICESCGIVRKSAIGFLSHLQSCGKSPQELAQLKKPCETCGRLMLSSSLQTHMYTAHKKVQKPLEETVCDATAKRPAAIRAAKLMEQLMEGCSELNERGSPMNNELYTEVPVPKLNNRHIGHLKRVLNKNGIASCRYTRCKFRTSTLEELLDHLAICVNKPKQHYSCQMCSFHTEEESNMLNHIENEHNYIECSEIDSDDSDNISISLEEERELIHDRPAPTSKHILKNRAEHGVTCSPLYGVTACLSALKRTLEYEQQHYEQHLFPSLHTTLADWVEFSDTEAHDYLPETKESMFFVSHNHDMMKENLDNASPRCKKLVLFEGDVLCGKPILFVGGPVWSIAWCPLPLQWTKEIYGQIDQFMAVSCHNNMERTYCMSQSYAHKGLIQIWNLGHLDNKSEGNIPVFCMGIAHEYGAVWCMEWCPSGCYDMHQKTDGTLLRIGVLAAACSDGSVRVFSVCHPTHLRSLNKNLKIFKPQPIASLVLNSKCVQGWTWQCLCLAWHTGKGHRVIAGGFTNAMIAVWSMDFETQILKLNEGKSQTILPYRIIQTHAGAITAIAFSSLGKDPRYILTESVDHIIKFWDLEESHNPLVMNKKGNVATYNLQLTDWMSHWDSGHCSSSLHSFRGFGADVNSAVTQNSLLGTVAANPWINAIAEATELGDLSVTFVHQFLHHTDAADKLKKSRRMMINHTGLLELKKYNLSDQQSSDLNNSFYLNRKQLEKKIFDSDHKEKTSKNFYFKTIPYEDCLMLQGKTEDYEFEIEFILEENGTSLKEFVTNDATEMHSSLNFVDRGENNFDDENPINNVHQRLLFHESECEKDDESFYGNMSIEKVQNIDKTEKDEKGGKNDSIGNNYKYYKNKKKETEIDDISQESLNMPFMVCIIVALRDPFFEPHPFSESFRSSLGISMPSGLTPGELISNMRVNFSSFQVTNEGNLALPTDGFINPALQVARVRHLYDCQRKSSQTVDGLPNFPDISEVNEVTEMLASEQDIKVSLKENCKHANQKSIPVADKQAANKKTIENNSVLYIENLYKMFSAGTNTQDVSKTSSAADLKQQIITSQKSKSNNRFKDTQKDFLGSYDEYSQLLYNKTENSGNIAGSISDSLMLERKPKTSNKNKINESGDFKSSADPHELRFSKPEVKTYEDFASSCGVLFCDFPKNNIYDAAIEKKTCRCQFDMLMPANTTAYPILSINRAAWNPNCHSFLWLAAGYQCGFVRTSCISAVHNHVMDDILRNTNHKEQNPRTESIVKEGKANL